MATRQAQKYVVEVTGVVEAIKKAHEMRCFERLTDGVIFPRPWYQEYLERNSSSQRQFQVIDAGDAWVVDYSGVTVDKEKKFKPSSIGRQSIMKKDAKIIMTITEENKIFANL